MNTAFFCATPYQILLALNMKYALKMEGPMDLYVLGHFSNAPEYVEKSKESGVFENVYFIDCMSFTASFSKKKAVNYVQKISAFFRSGKIVSGTFSIESKGYDEVYFAFPDMIIQLILKELFKQNKRMKIYMFEAGTGTYSRKVLAPSLAKKIFNKVTGTDKVLNKYDGIYVFKPELFPDQVDVPIQRIPAIDAKNLELKRVIDFIFQYEERYQIDEEVIFLEQPLYTISEDFDREVKKIIKSVLVSDFIVKLHPRTDVHRYNDFKVFLNNAIPWEVVCYNNPIDSKILISYHSTAAISNKIIFDQEPVLIFLFKMEELQGFYRVHEDFHELIDKVKALYRDPSRIITPKNRSEFAASVEKYRGKEVKC